MNYETVVVGALETNCYLISCEETHECAIIDPAAEPERIFAIIAEKGLQPAVILNTHGHIDHIGANSDMKEKFKIPLHIHSLDSPMLEIAEQSELSFFLQAKPSPPADSFFKDGDEVKIGRSLLRVLHTPGHSPGSVSFVGDGFLLSGDTLFCGGIGRTDLPGGNWDEIVDSINNKILKLPDELVVLPGHGPSTSVGQERNSNPFIQ